jgi:hypothetical protein
MPTKIHNAATKIPPILTEVLKSGICAQELLEPPDEPFAPLDLHKANAGHIIIILFQMNDDPGVSLGVLRHCGCCTS